MHRHDAHFIAAVLLVALDLQPQAPQPDKEALQGWRVTIIVIERQIQELVERFGRLRAEPGKHPGAHPFVVEQAGEKLVRWPEIRLRPPAPQCCGSRS